MANISSEHIKRANEMRVEDMNCPVQGEVKDGNESLNITIESGVKVMFNNCEIVGFDGYVSSE